MSLKNNWLDYWLFAGLVWFLVAIAVMPTNKLYQQGLIIFLWIPGLLVLLTRRASLVRLWQFGWVPGLAFAGLLLWSALTLLWAEDIEPARELKRLLYILLFFIAVSELAKRQRYLIPAFRIAGISLAAVVFCSLIDFYFFDGNPLWKRMNGWGLLAHPILGGYAVGVTLSWMLADPPKGRLHMLGWAICCIALGIFIAMTQSRGACLGLLVVLLSSPLWAPGRWRTVYIAAGVLLAVMGFALFQSYLTLRGYSYRPVIFASSLDMIMEAPLGRGLGASYEVVVKELGRAFDHAHNLWLHVCIELGIPGFLLWLLLWLSSGFILWRQRQMLAARMLMAAWIYSTVVVQFDAASLIDSARPEWFVTWLIVAAAVGLRRKKTPDVLQSSPPALQHD